MLSANEEALARGREVCDLVQKAARGVPDERAVRDLIRLAHDFPNITLRVPEFHEAMNDLMRHGRREAVARIMGWPRRGRKTESHFYLVVLVDRFLEQGCRSVGEAALRVRGQFGAQLAKDVAAIRNDYSRYKPLYDLFRASKYVPGEERADARWNPPT